MTTDILGRHRSSYDIGNVYEKVGTYYIAIDKNKLITYKKGKWVEVKTEVPAASVNELSIGELCDIWGVQLDRFDKIAQKYFGPDEDAKTQARKRKHQLTTEELADD